MAIGSILSGLISPVTELLKGRQARKAALQAAEAKRDEIMAEAAAKDSAVAGQLALLRVQNEGTSWKDEYALIVISGPFVVGMVSGALEGAGILPTGTTQAVMSGMFAHMENVPEWWSQTFQAGMLSALGITLWNKVKK